MSHDLSQPGPTVRWSGRDWAIREREPGVYALKLLNARGTPFEGRVLQVTVDGVWECKRDGTEARLVRFDPSSQLFERIVGSL